MAITGRKVLAPFSHQPDKNDPNLKFKLRGLYDIEQMEVGPLVTSDKESGDLILSAQTCRVLLEYGLLGWEGFKDEDGELIKFTASIKENIKRLTSELISDLAFEIWTATYMSEKDKKKSESQSTSPTT